MEGRGWVGGVHLFRLTTQMSHFMYRPKCLSACDQFCFNALRAVFLLCFQASAFMLNAKYLWCVFRTAKGILGIQNLFGVARLHVVVFNNI